VHLADEGGDGRRPEKPERDNPAVLVTASPATIVASSVTRTA
jgi:uncharacterized protein (DUF2345 family)